MGPSRSKRYGQNDSVDSDSVDPDQTAPLGEELVWSGSALFA